MRTAVVVAGGDPPPRDVLDDLPDEVWVVGADSGADRALELGLSLDLIVGDMDSISSGTVAASPNAQVMAFPADKDATDLELALDTVADRDDIDRVIVLGGTGGRLDHFLATTLILAAPRFADLAVEWLAHPGRVTVIHGHARLHGTVRAHISLLPVGGDVTGVTTTNLRWPLTGERLPFGSSRGVSNEFTAAVATVSIESGVLIAVQPVD